MAVRAAPIGRRALALVCKGEKEKREENMKNVHLNYTHHNPEIRINRDGGVNDL